MDRLWTDHGQIINRLWTDHGQIREIGLLRTAIWLSENCHWLTAVIS